MVHDYPEKIKTSWSGRRYRELWGKSKHHPGAKFLEDNTLKLFTN
jgi:hypothetical protein